MPGTQTPSELEAVERTQQAAQRAVMQEMYARSAKNLLRRDLRGAMEKGAGVFEIRQIVSKTFTCLSPGDEESNAYVNQVWHGVEQRFGVVVPEEQRGRVSAIRAVQRVSKDVGVRLTQSCLGDLVKELVVSEATTTHHRGGGSHGGFTFTAADIDSIRPRVKFLDSDDYAQGELLRRQARVEAQRGSEASEKDDAGQTGTSWVSNGRAVTVCVMVFAVVGPCI